MKESGLDLDVPSTGHFATMRNPASRLPNRQGPTVSTKRPQQHDSETSHGYFVANEAAIAQTSAVSMHEGGYETYLIDASDHEGTASRPATNALRIEHAAKVLLAGNE